MEKEMKLAVLIDGENISGKYIETILGEAAALGNVIYKRIYGNWTTNQMASWKEVILDNAIQPVQQYNNATGKNASDSSLIIDAMDLLYLGKLNGFVIVSSDSDFTRLAGPCSSGGPHPAGCPPAGERDVRSGHGCAEYPPVLYLGLQQVRLSGRAV